MTLISKRTYRLEQGLSVASSQEPLYEDDYPSAGATVTRPNDLAPFKKNVDCVVVGSAYSGNGSPFTELEVSLRLGSQIHKRLRVTANAPTDRVSLSYEHSEGGPGTPNPIGRMTATDGAEFTITPVVAPRRGDPIGIGPIAAAWPSRAVHRPLGWVPARGPQLGDVAAVPAGFFQCGPSDQQTDAVVTGDYLELRHLLPETPRFFAALPALAPIVLLFEEGRDVRLLTMRNDLFLIDTDRLVMTVTSRVAIPRTESSLGVIGSAEHASLEPEEIAVALGNPDATRWLRGWSGKRVAARTERPVTRSPRLTTKITGGSNTEEPRWLSEPRAKSMPSELVPPAAWPAAQPPTVTPVELDQSATMVLDISDAPAEPPPVGQPLPVAIHPLPVAVQPLPVAAQPVAVPVQPIAVEPASQRASHAAMPSYLKNQPPQRSQPEMPGHVARAALDSGASGASNAALSDGVQAEVASDPMDWTTAGGMLTLLFADELQLGRAGVTEELAALIDRAPRSTQEVEATDWAKDEREEEEPVVDLAVRVLVSGRRAFVSNVGFRPAPAAPARDLLRADLVRLEGFFSPVLSRVAVLRAMLRLAALALTPVDPARATTLSSLLDLLHDDLDSAPAEALAPVHDELERTCDGEERRPSRDAILQQAETLVRNRRSFATVTLPDGFYCIGQLQDGGAGATVLVPEAYATTLPNVARWPAVLIAKPTMGLERNRSATLVALVMGQHLDPTTLVFAPQTPIGERT